MIREKLSSVLWQSYPTTLFVDPQVTGPIEWARSSFKALRRRVLLLCCNLKCAVLVRSCYDSACGCARLVITEMALQRWRQSCDQQQPRRELALRACQEGHGHTMQHTARPERACGQCTDKMTSQTLNDTKLRGPRKGVLGPFQQSSAVVGSGINGCLFQMVVLHP